MRPAFSFAGKNAILATMHGKERVIAPLLDSALGVRLRFLPGLIPTDLGLSAVKWNELAPNSTQHAPRSRRRSSGTRTRVSGWQAKAASVLIRSSLFCRLTARSWS